MPFARLSVADEQLSDELQQKLAAETLGSVPPAVYVALFELSGESYGVNGRSQFARSHGIA